ncbi:MAG: hypothetical protein N2235_06015 [Fischerella sp.]|nr:hypothetical protein [Fischerella sp.]
MMGMGKNTMPNAQFPMPNSLCPPNPPNFQSGDRLKGAFLIDMADIITLLGQDALVLVVGW